MNPILIVDDNEQILKILTQYVENEGWPYLTARSGEEALSLFDAASPSIILLDVMLPGIDGLEVCRRIRTVSGVPILMITARDEDADRILGLDIGADDYIVKPFDTKELVARIKAVLRRFQAVDTPDKELSFPGLTINISQYTVTYLGRQMEMPPKELELLHFLASHPNTVFTREQLLEQVWGYDFFGDSRTVDVHVKRLRDKLPGCEKHGWGITTIWRRGYKFEVQ